MPKYFIELKLKVMKVDNFSFFCSMLKFNSIYLVNRTIEVVRISRSLELPNETRIIKNHML